MRDTALPVAQLAAIAAGMVAFAIASRGIAAVMDAAVAEIDYRAGMEGDAWFRLVR